LQFTQMKMNSGMASPKSVFNPCLILEDRGHELVITPKGGPRKLSWEATYKEMAAAGEDWSEWERTVADGLDEIPWDRPLPVPARKGQRAKLLGDLYCKP